jgi:adenylosuccinate synthase
MRSVPCAWVNDQALLLIGRGAIVNPEVLIHEVDAIEAAGYQIRKRMIVDEKATIITPADEHYEAGWWERIGSTQEGVGAARMRKIARNPDNWTNAHDAFEGSGIGVGDTTTAMAASETLGEGLLLEGTQGFGLSLVHGDWPYVTSDDTTTAALVSAAGFSGWPDIRLGVFRTYPIRVAGNSGPLPNEIDWDTLSERVGRVTVERTTVTGRIRRIAEWDWDIVHESIYHNDLSGAAITFADYIDPECEGITDWYKLTIPVRRFIDEFEHRTGTPVSHVGTGGPDFALALSPVVTGAMRGGDPGSRQDGIVGPTGGPLSN